MLTPLPPTRSGVADYSAELLRALARRVAVTAYSEGPADPIPGVELRRPRARELRRLSRFDGVVAHVGNSPSHAWILEAIRDSSVVVVLHDLVVHHLIADITIGRGEPEAYRHALATEFGWIGKFLACATSQGALPPLWQWAAHLYPLTSHALNGASGVIVHSRYAAEGVRAARPDLPVRVIPLLTPAPRAVNPERLIGDPFPVIGCFGFVIPEKRLRVVMQAFARLRREVGGARLVVVGEAAPGLDPHRMATEQGIPPEAITVEGYVSRRRYEQLVRAADIAVSLRHPTMGESSAAVAHQLSLGIPTIVSTGGWYDELPDEAVVRVSPGPGELEALVRALLWLASDNGARMRMGEAGRRYARERMDPDACADAYLRFVLAPAGRADLREEFLADVGRAIAAVAPAEVRRTTDLAGGIARAARSLGFT